MLTEIPPLEKGKLETIPHEDADKGVKRGKATPRKAASVGEAQKGVGLQEGSILFFLFINYRGLLKPFSVFEGMTVRNRRKEARGYGGLVQ